MRRKPLFLLAFVLMLYIAPMIFISSYSHATIPTEQNTNKDFLLAYDPWLTGWDKRRTIDIVGSAGAGTKYPVKIEVYYSGLFDLTYNISWADNAHQGVTTDGTYVYTTNSTMISKYQKDGTFVDSTDTTADRTYSAIGDLCYYDGYIYVIDHDGGHPAHQKAMKYLASDLSYVTSISLNDYYSDNSGSANIAYGNGSFWTQSDWTAPDTFFEVHRYDLSWAYQENWTVEAFSMSGSYRYQGFDWIDDNYFITVSHDGTEPDKIDFYYFNATTFSQYTQLARPEWTGEDSTTYEACQGLAVEIDGDTTYVWFASRNGSTQLGEVARYVLSADSENYQIYLERNCQTDFGDIRFTDDDGITELDYWMEDVTSSNYATFWVNVTDNLDSDVVIYLYYGTSDASSTTSSGVNTFLFYEDWESESIRDSLWDILDTDGSVSWSTTDATHGSVIRVQGDPGSYKYQFISDAANGYEWGASIAYRTRSKLEKTVASNQIVQVGMQNGSGNARLHIMSNGLSNKHTVLIIDDDGNIDQDSLAHNYWDAYYTYEVARNGTYARFWVDNEFVGEADNSPDEDDHVLNIYCRDSEKDVYNDWIIVRKWINSEPYVSAFGEEEDYLPPEWEFIGGAELIFVIPIDETGLDMLLIFLGLIMIPFSTLYLVKGGRSEMSSDKLFYGLIAFVIGWALFLGGIM